MKLTFKIILIIGVTVTTIISLIFSIMALRFEKQMEQELLSSARQVYKNILMVRKWVSEKEGVYVFKKNGEISNPYLETPDIITMDGDSLTLKNPALVTRELSELSGKMGENFSFHLASRKFLNPKNRPNDFEETALVYFDDDSSSRKPLEFYQIEQTDKTTYFRYFAPLFTEESCLSCHSENGYKKGDLRGGISILMSMERYQNTKKANFLFFILSAITSIIILGILIFFALRRIVILPLMKIEESATRIKSGEYDFKLKLPQNDEIGNLGQAFEDMREKIYSYTTQLKDSGKKYRNLIEQSLEAIAICSDSGAIIEFSQKFEHLTGYSADQLKNLIISDLIDFENKNQLELNLQTKIDAEHFESRLHSRDNLKIPVEVYIVREYDLGSLGIHSIVYVRDLSERKKIEQYALQSEKMYALGQLSSGIAHEIRNPVFALNNNIEYLKEKFGKKSEFREIYPELQDGINRIQKIISSILDYSRPHKIQFIQVNAQEVIEKCLNMVRRQFEKSSIQIETEFEEQQPVIKADPHRLEQVFINLFLNSFQAMDKAGILKVSIKNKGKFIQINIEDTGRGIPQSELNRIFDPFYTKSPGGTGLGLSIVHNILNEHQARCQVKSEAGLGTSFKIIFPKNNR